MKTISLSEIADLESGSGFPVDYQGETSGDLAFAKVSDISNAVRSGSRYIKSAKNYISRQKARELKAKVFPRGTIVFAKIGEAIKGNMRAMTTCEMLFDNNVMGVSSTSKGIDHIFLFHFLNTLDFYSLANKTSVPALRKSDLQRIQIPFPPIAEQKRIAAILDKAEELRSLRRQALGELDALTQSIFLEMFGNPATNPKGWTTLKLGDVIYSAKDGPHVSPAYVENGIPFLSARHIRRGEVLWTDLKFISVEDASVYWRRGKPERGDILYTKGGTTGIAKVIDFDQEIAFWVHIALLKPKHSKVEPLWLENMLNSKYCYQQSQRLTHGIANHDLGLNRMVNIEFYLPPLLLQQEFARRVEAIEQLKTTHRESLVHLDTLFASLQHRAFRGEL